MNKELKEKYISIATAEDTGKRKEKYQKYFDKKLFEVLEIQKILIPFDKPILQTSFCFGYGQNGISSEEDYRFSRDCADAVHQQFKIFLKKNTAEYDEQIARLQDDRYTYYIRPFMLKDCGGLDFTNNMEETKRYFPGQDLRILTEEDKQAVIEVVLQQKANIEKRCSGYWKRYGGSKLKTWTYLVD